MPRGIWKMNLVKSKNKHRNFTKAMGPYFGLDKEPKVIPVTINPDLLFSYFSISDTETPQPTIQIGTKGRLTKKELAYLPVFHESGHYLHYLTDPKYLEKRKNLPRDHPLELWDEFIAELSVNIFTSIYELEIQRAVLAYLKEYPSHTLSPPHLAWECFRDHKDGIDKLERALKIPTENIRPLHKIQVFELMLPESKLEGVLVK